MGKSKILKFIKKQKTVFLSSIDEEGFPRIRAMLKPRRIEDDTIYLSTNTSSKKVQQFLQNPNACLYVYHRGLFKYQGLTIVGKVEICQDLATKESIWKATDKIYYKKGLTDPDYCVLKFTCIKGDFYCDLRVEEILF